MSLVVEMHIYLIVRYHAVAAISVLQSNDLRLLLLLTRSYATVNSAAAASMSMKWEDVLIRRVRNCFPRWRNQRDVPQRRIWPTLPGHMICRF